MKPPAHSYVAAMTSPQDHFPGDSVQSEGPTTSRWAVAAFVLALLACVPLGVIFGIIALVEAKRGRRAGPGLALAAIVISVLWAAGAAGFYIVRHTSDLVVGTTQSGETLSVGECVDETPQGQLGGAEAGGKRPVGCDEPHSDEVFAILSLSYFPGGIADLDEIVVNCQSQLQKYSPSVAREPGVQIVWQHPARTGATRAITPRRAWSISAPTGRTRSKNERPRTGSWTFGGIG
ncbi:MAG: hypothetical protein QOC63_3150 [Mycobacterium sp.]|jgi:hypothetical protein|nr:hypothetical protein [Mycobacterium sp.]